MNKPKLWTALLAALLLVTGCKDFFHPEGPTKVPEPPLTDERAAAEFKEAVKEALKIEVVEIVLEASEEELAALEAKVDEALAAYAKLPEGARSALSAEKAKLDAAKEKIGHVNSAHSFQDDHKELLLQTPEELVTPEEAAALLPELNEALEAIGVLPEGAQELLAEEIALLEDLKEKAEELTAPPPPPVQHTITFDSHGGSAVEAITADTGTKVPKPADPTKANHDFAGWFDAAGAAYTWDQGLTGDVTLYAQWQPKVSFEVTIENQDGNILDQNEPITIFKGGAGGDDSFTATVSSGYADAKWYLNGIPLGGSGTSMTINAKDYKTGSHYLGVSVEKDGVYYSTDIYFTVEEEKQ
jgi:uncharacterized repeat protein (TIGR02543 family)